MVEHSAHGKHLFSRLRKDSETVGSEDDNRAKKIICAKFRVRRQKNNNYCFSFLLRMCVRPNHVRLDCARMNGWLTKVTINL